MSSKLVIRRSTTIILLTAICLMSHLPADAKDKIYLGSAITLSGPLARPADIMQVSVYKMWAEETNAQGGILLGNSGKRMPVELVLRDDQGNPEKCSALVKELIQKDKVDLLLSPYGTARYFSVIPIANKHGYPLLGPTVSSEKLREHAGKLPCFFGLPSLPREQAQALVGLLEELGIKKVAVLYVSNPYGIECSGQVVPQLSKSGIKISLIKSYPMDPKTMPQLLQMVKAMNPDAVLAFSYAPDTFLIAKLCKSLDFNPKLLYLAVGVAMPAFRNGLGASMVEGICGPGVWNPRMPFPGAKKFFEDYKKRWGKEPDRWACAMTYASLQILQQAIEKVGSLDREKIRETIAKDTFSTVVGPVKFEKGLNTFSPGQVGQWQQGEFLAIAPRDKRQAQPLFPKPKWP